MPLVTALRSPGFNETLLGCWRSQLLLQGGCPSSVLMASHAAGWGELGQEHIGRGLLGWICSLGHLG